MYLCVYSVWHCVPPNLHTSAYVWGFFVFGKGWAVNAFVICMFISIYMCWYLCVSLCVCARIQRKKQFKKTSYPLFCFFCTLTLNLYLCYTIIDGCNRCSIRSCLLALAYAFMWLFDSMFQYMSAALCLCVDRTHKRIHWSFLIEWSKYKRWFY